MPADPHGVCLGPSPQHCLYGFDSLYSSLILSVNDEPKPSLTQSDHFVQLTLTGYTGRFSYSICPLLPRECSILRNPLDCRTLEPAASRQSERDLILCGRALALCLMRPASRCSGQRLFAVIAYSTPDSYDTLPEMKVPLPATCRLATPTPYSVDCTSR